MNLVLYGATGRAGSRLLHEALDRGHSVKAVVRNASALEAKPGLSLVTGDLSEGSGIAAQIKGADAVVSAYAPPQDNTDMLLEVTQRLVEAVRQANGPRLMVVGGAGTLNVARGVPLIDSGYLPAEWTKIAQSHAKTLEMLRHCSIEWTYLSPAAYFEPGERTGRFRIADDDLLTGEDGVSRISMEDYAIALLDELEQRRYVRRRFAVGY